MKVEVGKGVFNVSLSGKAPRFHTNTLVKYLCIQHIFAYNLFYPIRDDHETEKLINRITVAKTEKF